MKINKDSIKTIVIVILLFIGLILVGFILLPSYTNEIYTQGFSDGQINIVQTQTQTGNIFIINNGTVQGYSLNVLCEGLK